MNQELENVFKGKPPAALGSMDDFPALDEQSEPKIALQHMEGEVCFRNIHIRRLP